MRQGAVDGGRSALLSPEVVLLSPLGGAGAGEKEDCAVKSVDPREWERVTVTLAPEGETASEVERTLLYTVKEVGEEESALFPSGLVPPVTTTGYQVTTRLFNSTSIWFVCTRKFSCWHFFMSNMWNLHKLSIIPFMFDDNQLRPFPSTTTY